MISKYPFIIKLIFFIFFFCSIQWVQAQVPCDPETDPFCDPEGNPEDPFEPVPIDGGVSALLVGGILLGARAYRNRKTKEEESSAI